MMLTYVAHEMGRHPLFQEERPDLRLRYREELAELLHYMNHHRYTLNSHKREAGDGWSPGMIGQSMLQNSLSSLKKWLERDPGAYTSKNKYNHLVEIPKACLAPGPFPR